MWRGGWSIWMAGRWSSRSRSSTPPVGPPFHPAFKFLSPISACLSPGNSRPDPPATSESSSPYDFLPGWTLAKSWPPVSSDLKVIFYSSSPSQFFFVASLRGDQQPPGDHNPNAPILDEM
ncbi:hypothetical protein PCASD_15073 [Puccinia coronata f. sp. avenae]|uniref:Uncharacterized protein n=1 Tax=Puccinia coronata f. sp. avenae TaxID=200324 RepID=A0A2N5UAT1_9BASI|nr:hypothetical protein PCASD_15073 [Puccinia coronata f. sp. avenae]